MKRILYVEDDSTLCAIFKLVMERRGYIVDIALNGNDGMAMHTAEPYDIVALDYQLPDMTGLDIARDFLSRNKELPIIIITGRGNEKIAAEALEIGVSNYIVKDSERSYLDLLPAVVSHLERRLEIIQVMKSAEESLRESSEQLHAQLLTQIDTADRYEQQAMELVEQAESLVVAKGKLDDFAYYDEKTGLPNLRLCLDRMEFALGAARRNKMQVAVMALTLDMGRFSNEVLREVAHCLGNLCRSVDTVGRLDDGNFLFILGDIEDQSASAIVARKAIQSLDEFLGSVDATVSVDIKVGIALYPGDGTMAKGLIKAATDAVRAIWLDDKTDIVFATPPGDALQ